MSTRVLLVDDSPTARLALRRLLERPGSGMTVVAEASTGREAMRAIATLRPDVITMDVHLGREDGVEVTAAVMSTTPLPIVIITGARADDPALVFRAMRAGALEVFAKPAGSGQEGHAENSRRLVRAIKALSSVPVVTHRRPAAAAETTGTAHAPDPRRPNTVPPSMQPRSHLLIGASTGGPALLHELLSALRAPLRMPTLIVQHIEEGFGEGLGRWLAGSGHRVQYVDRSHRVEPGTVYLAPDNRHMRLIAPDLVVPIDAPPRNHQCPSVDELFESAIVTAPSVLAVLLSGMGSDGAEGMLQLRHAGARTIAQQPDTCVVAGMPGSAIAKGAAAAVLTPSGIADEIARLDRLRAPTEGATTPLAATAPGQGAWDNRPAGRGRDT